MSEVTYITVGDEESGQRLDNFLVKHLKGVPKSYIYRIIRSGEVRVNKKRAKPLQKLIMGDAIRVPPTRRSEAVTVVVGDVLKDLLEASILYEDNRFLVLNKPAGLAVHGGSGLSLGVIEAFREMRPKCDFLELVHRLDKETSGCLLIAKKRSTLKALNELLATRLMQKTYWAVLNKPWQGAKTITVNQPIEKNTLQSGERKVKVSQAGKASVTDFTLLENYHDVCLVKACPKTGRTHQIRIHSAYLSHPIVGDEKYGGPKQIGACPQRLYLHARSLQFNLGEESFNFEAPLDKKFTQTLALLGSVDN